MNLKKSLTKKISFVLIVTILSLNLSFLSVPKQAGATWPSWDYGNFIPNVGKYIGDNWWRVGQAALASLAKSLARQLILKVTASTVDWINGGMQGSPAYLADFNKFVNGEGGIVDRTVGDFVSQTAPFLCGPFQAQMALSLQVGYNGFKFKDQIGCSLTDVTRNINNAIKTAGVGVNIQNVSGSGKSGFTLDGSVENSATPAFEGWNSWLQNNISPDNNPIGTLLQAQSELNNQIVTAKKAIETDVSNGGGAMSFQECTDIYLSQSGNEIGRSKPYAVGTGESTRPQRPVQDPNAGPQQPYGETKRDCTVKTPGSTITEMLGFKATGDQRMNELTGAMADGIDAIFSALVNQIITRSLSQIKKGVLDNGRDTQAQTQAALTGLGNISSASLNQAYQAQSAQDQITSGLGAGIPPGYSIPSFPIAPSILPSLATTSTSTGPAPTYGTGGGALDQARNNSIILINSLSRSESGFQNNYLIAENVLVQARNIFASSSLCNITYGRTSSVLRSVLIRANVITNIEGIPNPDRTIASIPWNLPVIRANASTSNAHMLILSTAANTVNSAPNISDITTAMIPVNSTNFNTDPQATLVPNIKTWLTGVQSMYNSTICPINLTNVMRINSATSTGN